MPENALEGVKNVREGGIEFWDLKTPLRKGHLNFAM